MDNIYNRPWGSLKTEKSRLFTFPYTDPKLWLIIVVRSQRTWIKKYNCDIRTLPLQRTTSDYLSKILLINIKQQSTRDTSEHLLPSVPFKCLTLKKYAAKYYKELVKKKKVQFLKWKGTINIYRICLMKVQK